MKRIFRLLAFLAVSVPATAGEFNQEIQSSGIALGELQLGCYVDTSRYDEYTVDSCGGTASRGGDTVAFRVLDGNGDKFNAKDAGFHFSWHTACSWSGGYGVWCVYENLYPGQHERYVTVTDQATGQSRTLSATAYIFPAY